MVTCGMNRELDKKSVISAFLEGQVLSVGPGHPFEGRTYVVVSSKLLEDKIDRQLWHLHLIDMTHGKLMLHIVHVEPNFGENYVKMNLLPLDKNFCRARSKISVIMITNK